MPQMGHDVIKSVSKEGYYEIVYELVKATWPNSGMKVPRC